MSKQRRDKELLESAEREHSKRVLQQYGQYEMVNGGTLNDANDRIKELQQRIDRTTSQMRVIVKMMRTAKQSIASPKEKEELGLIIQIIEELRDMLVDEESYE